MEQTECSETSAYKIQTPGNYQKESIQHTEHGESLKLRNLTIFILCVLIHFFSEEGLRRIHRNLKRVHGIKRVKKPCYKGLRCLCYQGISGYTLPFACVHSLI